MSLTETGYAYGLDLIINDLNKCLSVLNFLDPPANPEDHKHHIILCRSIAAASREREIGQDVQHSKPKLVESFIKGSQATLIEFTNLLANLILNSLCYLKLQKKKNYKPLIV